MRFNTDFSSIVCTRNVTWEHSVGFSQNSPVGKMKTKHWPTMHDNFVIFKS